MIYIPSSTLHDCITGKVSATADSGAPHSLDEDEEKELVKFLLRCAKVGYPKTIKAVRVTNSTVVAKKQNQSTGTTTFISHGWWHRNNMKSFVYVLVKCIE